MLRNCVLGLDVDNHYCYTLSMNKQLDFEAKARYARKLTNEQLSFAAKDCAECIAQNVDPYYYSDELSVYRQEAAKRGATL